MILKNIPGRTIAAFAALALLVPASATGKPLIQFGKKSRYDKERAEAMEKATNVVVNLAGPQPLLPLLVASNSADPLANLWSDPEFIRRFAGVYGFHSDLEPKFNNTNEQYFYREELYPTLSTNKELALQLMETNVYAQSNAIFFAVGGAASYEVGRIEDSIKKYERALELWPNYLRAHKGLGYALARAARYGDAIKPLTRTIEMGGADGTIYGLLGYCYMNQEQFLSAEAAYRNAVILMPDSRDWKMGLIQAQIRTQKYMEADALLGEMLKASPNDDSLWKLQAGLYRQMEQYDKAAVNYEVLRRMGKADLETAMLLGDIYLSQGAKELALEAYMEGIKQDGVKDVSRSIKAAEVLVGRGAWDESKNLIKQIRQVHGAKITGKEDLSLLKLESRVEMAGGESSKAGAVLEKIIERNPMDGEALLLLGDLYAAGEQLEKAMFRYDMASKLPEFEPDALVKKAQLEVKQRKFTQAIDLLRKAQKIRPKDNVQRFLESVERVARTSGT